jgi:hypothetical protein
MRIQLPVLCLTGRHGSRGVEREALGHHARPQDPVLGVVIRRELWNDKGAGRKPWLDSVLHSKPLDSLLHPRPVLPDQADQPPIRTSDW